MNLCTACGLDFGSVSAFDKHRAGKHEYTFKEGLYRDPPVEDGRRCLDEDEMRAQGFALSARNLWSIERDLLRARERQLLTSDEASDGDGE